MHPRRSSTLQPKPVSSRDPQNGRPRASSDAASVSVMAYGISNIEE